MKIRFILLFFLLLIAGFGCQKGRIDDNVTTLDGEAENQRISDADIQQEYNADSILGEEVLLYRGEWFDIQYPSSFTTSPIEPVHEIDGVTFVATNEAYFTSPDGDVEFFVFSPQWSGDPETYLAVADNEEFVDEEVQEDSGSIKTWVTLHNIDGAYYRSYVSQRVGVGTGSATHIVFGIKYRDYAVYTAYQEAYERFKDSLIQYAD